jgi:hypothetical protein
MTPQTWYCPSSTGKPAEPKIGPGEIPNDPRAAYPWDVLQFVKGYLTIDTTDKHYPEWRRWLDMSAPSLGLKIVDTAQAEAIADPTSIPCPVDPERCDWRGPAAGRDHHILAHRPPNGEYYEPPKLVTRETAF